MADFEVSRVAFTVRQAEKDSNISYGRANTLVNSLLALGVLGLLNNNANNRRCYAAEVLRVLLQVESSAPP